MIKNYFHLLRVPQWIKIFCFCSVIVFSAFLKQIILYKLLKVFIFCLASSFIYIINDIIDIEADAAHPKKKLRPLPSGKISKRSAWYASVLIFCNTCATFIFSKYSFYFVLDKLCSVECFVFALF